VDLLENLDRVAESGHHLPVHRLLEGMGAVHLMIEDREADFANINTQADLLQAESRRRER
jgi:molybdopterin-guanine dinucleotide biosynthesis protein A